MLHTLLESVKYKEVYIKPIDFFDYPQSRTDVFKEIENYVINRLETSRFPEIITLDKQPLNLTQSINFKDNSKF
jgi:hypothetical protein